MTDGGDPGMDLRIGVIPPSQVVELQHADTGKEETQEPQKRAGITEAQVELEEGRQQKHRENQRGKVVAVGHGNAIISVDVCTAGFGVGLKTRRQIRVFPGADLNR